MTKTTVILSVSLALVVVALAIGGFYSWGLRRDMGIAVGQMRRADRAMQKERERNQELEATIEVLKMSMAHKVIELRDSVKTAQAATSKWKTEYAKAKNTHIDRAMPDAELDSLVTRFLKRN